MKHLSLLAVLLCLAATPCIAADTAAIAKGAADQDQCFGPMTQTGNLKAYEACLKQVDAAYAGPAEAKGSYSVGLYFQGWSMANLVAAGADKDLFPEIKKRSKAKPERQLAMRLFDKFRGLQKKLKISDDDLAKSAGYELAAVQPHLDYYDQLPKK